MLLVKMMMMSMKMMSIKMMSMNVNEDDDGYVGEDDDDANLYAEHKLDNSWEGRANHRDQLDQRHLWWWSSNHHVFLLLITIIVTIVNITIIIIMNHDLILTLASSLVTESLMLSQR